MMFYSQTEIIYRKISDILFVIGFVTAIVSAILSPDRYNLIILALYIVLGILISLVLKPQTFGSVVEKQTGLPLSFGIVRVFNPEFDKEMFARPTDALGRYYILVPKGKYYLKIEKKNNDGSYSLLFTSRIISIKSGIIQEKFVV